VKKTIILKATITVIFVLFFIFASEIALAIASKEIIRPKELREFPHEKSIKNVFFNIDNFVANQDIFYSVEISGWAFITATKEIDNKKIDLLFVSDNINYEIKSDLIDRLDLRSSLRENNVDGLSHGFISTFSPILMKNGQYKLFIYCYQNDEDSGWVDTGRIFLKENKSFIETQSP